MTDVKVPGYIQVADEVCIRGKDISSFRANGNLVHFWVDRDDEMRTAILPFPEFARRLAEALAETNGSETPKGSPVPLQASLGERVHSISYSEMQDMDTRKLCVLFMNANTALDSCSEHACWDFNHVKDDVVKVIDERIARAYDQGREAGRVETIGVIEKSPYVKTIVDLETHRLAGRNPPENPATRPDPTPAPPMPPPVIPISRADLRTAKESWSSDPTPAPPVTDSPDAGQGVEDVVQEIDYLVEKYGVACFEERRNLCEKVRDEIHTRLTELAGPRQVKVEIKQTGETWSVALKDNLCVTCVRSRHRAMEIATHHLAPLGLVPEFVE